MGQKIQIKSWYGLVATVLGLGRYSKMPGTLGTLAACVVLIVTGKVSLPIILVTIAIGTLAADKYAKETGNDDPSEVVIDEVAGYWVSMWGLDPGFAVIGFFLFRVIDIVKPFPVRHMERLPGGIGIMADDVCGGIVVNLLIRLILWLFVSGGLDVVYQYLGIGG